MQSRRSFIYVGVFSFFINMLFLTPSIYMLQVYDRVVASRSESTLVMLTVIVAVLFAVMAILEFVRSRILARISTRMDVEMQSRVVDVMFRHALHNPRNASIEPLNDLNSVRNFVSSNGTFAFFDAPWFPIYIAIMFMFHPWFGWFGLISGVIILILGILVDHSTKPLLQASHGKGMQSRLLLERSLRNAEVATALGVKDGIFRRWQTNHNESLHWQAQASDKAGLLSNMSKSLRMFLQSLILGVGAYLVIQMEMSGGMMIAGSILLGRALAPLDSLVGAWKGFSSARQSWDRLNQLLAAFPDQPARMALPAPQGKLDVSHLTVVPPGSRAPVLHNITFALRPGESLAIIGPSGSGKSSLVRAVLGLWPQASGEVRLDNADMRHWDRAQLSKHIGYLPQDVELFDGTVAENIARFGEVDAQKVLEAADLAGVHELILQLPNAYETLIGPSGGALSGGQRQRIGLARALYDSPTLVVLDEPNSNLDDLGEAALYRALEILKERNTTVLIISHRPGILKLVDRILVMVGGTVAMFGDRQQVLAKMAQKTTQLPTREANTK
ncbi:type I secretion system permease/ATPase [Thiothrix winogradskyi]|uniref:Type I secretion system permease/ATPase n=1 Tax=Thiothrix winogradskyi TaxID=96472 RepID=A0ABY3T0K0_9GAMM|nr:type I secretion system permease/ATPase [Thiothrix winogradskyi]UJS24338.1 type I secretion system permease/ATPase [Thiothrix winogradskyi]